MYLPRLKSAWYFTIALGLLLGITSLFWIYWSVKVVSQKTKQRRDLRPEKLLYTEEWMPQKFQFMPQNFETIHVVEICHNKDSVRKLVTFVKSLLTFRSTPIFLHVLTNQATSISVQELFRTWRLPYFEIKLYVRPDVEEATNWIPFVHPAGKYAFKKLLIHEIITDVERAIFYDADIVLTTDIYQLWKRFDDFDQEQSIGMGYETQFWYRMENGEKHEDAWPAISWGFNTGMVMYNLDRLRKKNFTALWRKEAKSQLRRQGYAWLAEQDVLNVVFLHYQRILYKASCLWNVQFGERVNIESCPRVRNYLALHATLEKLADASPEEVPLLPQYWDILTTFMNLNGGIFSESSMEYHRIFPFVTDFNFESLLNSTDDVSLVLFLQIGDVYRLESVNKTWPGHMSIAIGGSDKDLSLVKTLPVRDNIAYHFVFQTPGGSEVPENILKTVALRYAPTTHFVIGDLRYYIRDQTYDKLRNSLPDNKDSFVAMPQFRTNCHIFQSFRSKSQLSQQIQAGKISTIPGINSTLYSRWLKKKEPFQITWGSEDDKYIMMPKSGHPLFHQPYKDLEVEEVDISDEWMKDRVVTVLPNCLALMVPDLGNMFGDHDFSIRC